jgi:chromosome segregation ATPase
MDEMEVLHEEMDKSLMSENSSLQSKLKQLQKTLKEVEAAKIEAEEALQCERDELRGKVEFLNQKCQLLEQKAEEEENNCRESLCLEKEEKEHALNRVRQAESESESLSKEREQLKKNYEEEQVKVAEMTQAIKEQLRREISVKEELQASKQELDECRSSIAALHQQLEANSEKNHEESQREAELLAMRSECERLNNIISDFREKEVRVDEKQLLEVEIARSAHEEVEQLQASLSALREESQGQERRANEAESEVTVLREEVAVLRGNLMDLEKLQDEASRNAHAIEPLMVEIETLRMANKELMATEERQKQELEERNMLIDSMRESENSERQAKQKEIEGIADVKEECGRHMRELERLAALALQQETELSKLKEDLINSEFVIDEHKAQLESSTARCAEVEAKVAKREVGKEGTFSLF